MKFLVIGGSHSGSTISLEVAPFGHTVLLPRKPRTPLTSFSKEVVPFDLLRPPAQLENYERCSLILHDPRASYPPLEIDLLISNDLSARSALDAMVAAFTNWTAHEKERESLR